MKNQTIDKTAVARQRSIIAPFLLALLFLTSVQPSIAADKTDNVSGDKVAIALNALQRLSLNENSDEWLFKGTFETWDKSDEDNQLIVEVAEHNPNIKENEGWTLLSVDGQPPSQAQTREFYEKINEEDEDKSEDENKSEEDESGFAQMVDTDSLAFVSEDQNSYVFRFSPMMDDEGEEEFSGSMAGKLTVDKQQHIVTRIELENIEEVSPATSVNLEMFHMVFEFAMVKGQLMPVFIMNEVKGTAFFFNSFHEYSTQRFEFIERITQAN